MRRIQPTPMRPEMVAPMRSPGRDFPEPPAWAMRMKAMPRPGSVAWERASPRSARFRRSMKVPIIPAATPRAAAPRTTTRVL
jgi:hypothetical protein